MAFSTGRCNQRQPWHVSGSRCFIEGRLDPGASRGPDRTSGGPATPLPPTHGTRSVRREPYCQNPGVMAVSAPERMENDPQAQRGTTEACWCTAVVERRVIAGPLGRD